MATKRRCLGNLLLIFGSLPTICEALNRKFNSQPQIDAKFCMNHNFTYSDVSLVQCAAICVRSEGCRAVAFTAATKTCLGCGYVMETYYEDQYEVPVNASSGSIAYTPALSEYLYIDYYASCDIAITCADGKRALPIVVHDASMTPALCFGICNQYGTRYFGNEAGDFCLCGQIYDKYGNASGPTENCTGDNTKICGGLYLLSVYENVIED